MSSVDVQYVLNSTSASQSLSDSCVCELLTFLNRISNKLNFFFLVSQGSGYAGVFTGAGFPWVGSGEVAGVGTWAAVGRRW